MADLLPLQKVLADSYFQQNQPLNTGCYSCRGLLMPRTSVVLGRWGEATVQKLVTEIYHYRVTFPDGRCVLLDEDAFQKRRGLVKEITDMGSSSSYCESPSEAINAIGLWKNAFPEEKMSLALSGLKVEMGTFKNSYEAEFDYS